MEFTWDDAKRRPNIEKHNIDFFDAAEIFQANFLTLPGRSDFETRQIAVGALSDQVIAVIYAVRDDTTRIISARKARKNEREQYQALHNRRDPSDEVPN